MKKIILILLSCILTIVGVGCSSTSSGELSTKEKVEDFNYMFETIKEGYPFLSVNERVNGVDWVSNYNEYLEKVESTKNDEEFVEVMSEIVYDLNNGHTCVINDKKLYEMFRDGYGEEGWYDFFEKEVIANRYEKIGTTLEEGEEVFNTEDITVEDVVDGKVGYIHLPSMKSTAMGVSEQEIQGDLNSISAYINKLDKHDSFIIDIRGNGGGDDSYWHSIVSMLIDEDVTKEGYLPFRNECKIMKDYVEKRGLNLQPIENMPKEVLENAPKEVATDFSEFYKQEITIKSNKDSNFNGSIYLLVDESVYSSAESFSIFCKDTGFATIIGERTSGDGGGIDSVLFDLENSGLIVRMSSDMYLSSQGICNEEFKTTPDYEVEDVKRYDNLIEDKCIQKVLELEDIDI